MDSGDAVVLSLLFVVVLVVVTAIACAVWTAWLVAGLIAAGTLERVVVTIGLFVLIGGVSVDV